MYTEKLQERQLGQVSETAAIPMGLLCYHTRKWWGMGGIHNIELLGGYLIITVGNKMFQL